MFKSKIFLHNKNKKDLSTLEEAEWQEEELLQKFLADYPDLLPGDQIDPDKPRRWMLVSREMIIPDSDELKRRWSLDHLFLDQDGIPTFVECKRASDNRSRRQVVAQMLDYAANGIKYWDIENNIKRAIEKDQEEDFFLSDKIIDLCGKTDDEDLDEEKEVEDYWDKVKTNLESHKIRLIFVLDSVPSELKRLVEFLNEEMRHVEVYAVEIKRYKREEKESETLLVPKVIGLTGKAQELKQTKTYINKNEFMSNCNEIGEEFFKFIFNFIGEKDGFKIRMGTKGFSARVKLSENEYGSFFHGYPTEHSYKKFQIKFEDWLGEDNKKILTDELAKFNDVLDDNYNANLTEKNKERLEEAFKVLVNKIDEIF